jgi:hypothetical protein
MRDIKFKSDLALGGSVFLGELSSGYPLVDSLLNGGSYTIHCGDMMI